MWQGPRTDWCLSPCMSEGRRPPSSLAWSRARRRQGCPRGAQRPWTFGMTLTADPGQPLFEYACHEGNYPMRNIISAARAEEARGGQVGGLFQELPHPITTLSEGGRDGVRDRTPSGSDHQRQGRAGGPGCGGLPGAARPDRSQRRDSAGTGGREDGPHQAGAPGLRAAAPHAWHTALKSPGARRPISGPSTHLRAEAARVPHLLHSR